MLHSSTVLIRSALSLARASAPCFSQLAAIQSGLAYCLRFLLDVVKAEF